MAGIIIDRFVKGTTEFEKLYNEMFNTYFPSFEMECLDYDHYTEHYKINGMHKITCHILNDEIYEIVVERYYYYYNK